MTGLRPFVLVDVEGFLLRLTFLLSRRGLTALLSLRRLRLFLFRRCLQVQFFIFAFLFFTVPDGEVPDDAYFPLDFVEVLADQFALLFVIAQNNVAIVALSDRYSYFA